MIAGNGNYVKIYMSTFYHRVSYMELLTPDFYSVLSGTLSQGTFCKQTAKGKRDSIRSKHNVYDVDFSGRNVAVLLNFIEEKDFQDDKTIEGLDSASIRFNQCVDIDTHNHWGRTALKKLKADRGITLVDSKPRVVTTVSDIRYQERLNSFFEESSPNEVVNPLFSQTGRFDPEVLAAHGWEYSPPKYDSEKELELSWRYYVAKKRHPGDDSLLPVEDMASDAIKSYCKFGRNLLFDFNNHDKFPEGLAIKDGVSSRFVKRMIFGLKKIYESSLLSVKEQPHKAVVVKLAGYHDFLLTTLEHEDQLNFETFPDNDLLSCFRDSWQEHIKQIDSKEFVCNTLPTLEKILPAIVESYKVLVDCVEMISGMSHAMIEVFDTTNIDREAIKERLVEFKLLYRELVLIQKQIEFYKVAGKKVQRNIDGMDKCTWLEYFTFPRYLEVNGLGINHQVAATYFKKWFVRFSLAEKEKANSMLKDLERRLFIAKYKISIQSDLERMLCNLTGKLIGFGYSCDNESLKKDCLRLSGYTNEVLVMIALNKPAFNGSHSCSLESLDLAADLTVFD